MEGVADVILTEPATILQVDKEKVVTRTYVSASVIKEGSTSK